VGDDLAELIVQLGHDRPSHILVPAIHRNRAEIRDIFLAEMADVDPGLTDEPAVLAGAARRHLRRKFLSAKVAISGANFAVAETGTLAVVESEGNGRMCLTLPETLITVMGIEKSRAPAPRPRGVPAAAAALVDRRADEPVHLDVDRRRPGRRAAGRPPDPGGQRPDGGAVRRRRPGCAELHPLLGLPQRLPGVRAGRRPCVRLGLSRPDRRDPVAAADRGGGQRLPAVRQLAVRGLLRRLPGKDQHPEILVHLRAEHVEEQAAQRRTPTAEAALMRTVSWVMRDPKRWALALRSGRLGGCSAAGAG
jgi:L-lactate dehydrogenase complex protein LldF